MSRSRALLIAWLLGATALTLTLTAQPFRYGDEWWHIALGREILSHGIPTQEPFSFVATQHVWVEQQWLLEMGLAKLVALGGPAAASLAMGVAGSLAFTVASLAVPGEVRIGGGWRAAAVVFAALVAAPAMGVRGEVISALGVAITMLIVRRWRDGSERAVWFLPPLFLVWANLHSGFVAGLAILVFALLFPRQQPIGSAPPTGSRGGQGEPAATAAGGSPAIRLGLAAVASAFIAVVAGLIPGAVVLALLWSFTKPKPAPAGGVSRRPLAIATGAAAVITLANPAGVGLYAYIVDTLSNPLLSQFVSEWLSPNFHDSFTRLIEVLAAVLVLCWALSGRARVEDMLLAGAAFLATLQAIRNVSLLAVVAVPQLAEYGSAAWAGRAPARLRMSRSRPAPAVALAAAAGVAVASLAATIGRLTPVAAADFERTRQPAAAADYAAGHLAGQRLFSTDLDGGYLAYRFPDRRLVFVYDEIGIFGEAPLNDYLDLAQLRSPWRTVLGRYQLHHAILPAGAADVSALLELGWTVDCYDPASGRAVLSDGGPPPLTSPPDPTTAPGCG